MAVKGTSRIAKLPHVTTAGETNIFSVDRNLTVNFDQQSPSAQERVSEIDSNRPAISDCTRPEIEQTDDETDDDTSDLSLNSSNTSLAPSTSPLATSVETTEVGQQTSTDYRTTAEELGRGGSSGTRLIQYEAAHAAQALCNFQSNAQQLNSASFTMGFQSPSESSTQIGES